MTRLDALLNELVLFVYPLAQAAQDKESMESLCQTFGFDLNDDNLTFMLEAAQDVAKDTASSFDNLDNLDTLRVADIVLLTSNVLEAIEAITESSFLQSAVSSEDDLILELFDFLTYQYLSIRIYLAESALAAVGVATHELIATTHAGGRQVDFVRVKFQWSRLAQLVQDTEKWAYDVYGWAGNPGSGDAKEFNFVKAIRNSIDVVHATGLSIAHLREITDASEIEFFLKNVGDEQVFEAFLPFHQSDVESFDEENNQPVFSTEAGLKLVPFGDLTKPENLGLALAPYSKGDVPSKQQLSERLTLDVLISGQATGGVYLTITPGGIDTAGGEAIDAEFNFSATYRDADQLPILLIGDSQSSHIETGAILGAVGGNMRGDFYLAAGFNNLKVVFDVREDSFLNALLSSPIEINASDVVMEWRTGRGVSFRGGTSLGLDVPVNLDLGAVSIRQLRILLDMEMGASALLMFSASVQLGPVSASPENVGMRLAATRVPSGAGILGKYDLAFGFKPPDSIGLLIDAASVVGAGYLSFDPDKEQYAGNLQLEFNGIALNAVGLLTTRMPDGSAGFSLLVSISAEDFPPINLGFGFTLNGVGGLLGVNRTVAVEVLRTGIKNRSLDSVLFPEDPARNAPQIVSDLRTVFPPARGRHVFGPMAIIGWGTPTALTIELGLVLELPQPARLIALGQFRARLPSEERPLVRLNMDALGVVDFDKGEASLDATLYDSRIAGYALSGDMALRSRWRKDPTFALAVGGLNPRFQPPPGFPALQRVAVSLTTGNNPRLRLEAYLALTSNTAQLGARLDLFVRAVGFSIEGYLGFDALFEFSPFRFIADFGGGVSLKWHGHNLAGVQLEMTLSGPTPVQARGKATFKIWKFSKSVDFDETLGGGEPPPPLPPADPLPELLRALADGRNWSAQLPGTGRSLVSLRDTPGTVGVLAHPLGELTFRQRVVPLNVEISRYGNTVPGGDRIFTLAVDLPDSGDGNEVRPVTDYFAPAQFFEMGDTAKLTRPSFELMDSGVSIGTEGVTYGGRDEEGLMTSTSIEYETRLVDAEDGLSRDGEPYTPPADVLEELTGLGAAALSPARHAGRAKYQAPALGVTLGEPQYVVARRDDLTRESIAGVDGDAGAGVSYTAAVEALRRHLADHPAERADLQVVAEHEVAGATQ